MTTPSVIQHPTPAWRKWGVFIAMCMAIFVPAFNTTSVVNAMIPIRDQFHLNSAVLQWIVNAYMLPVMSLLVIAGLLGDRFGRRRMFYAGSALFMLGTVFCAISTSAFLLLLGRACQGAGGSVLLPGTLAIMRVYFPPEKQGLMNAGWAAGMGLGFGFGPMVSGLCISTIGWPYLFWITLAVLLVANILLAVSVDLPEPKNEEVQIDFIGLFVFICGIVPFTFAMINSSTWGWESPVILTLFLVGICCLLLLPWIESRVKKTPLLDFSHFKLPAFFLASVGQFIAGFGLIGVYFFIGIYFQNPLLGNLNVLQAGLALLPTGIGLLLGALIAPYLREKIGCFHEALLIFGLMLFGLIWLFWQSAQSPYVLIWVPLLFLGWGLGMGNASFPRIALESVPAEQANRASSLVNGFLYLGCILSTSLGMLIALQVGESRFLSATAHLKIPMFQKLNIEHLIIGHGGRVPHLIARYSRGDQSVLYHAAIQSAWSAVCWALVLVFIFVVFAAVTTVMLWCRDKKIKVAH